MLQLQTREHTAPPQQRTPWPTMCDVPKNLGFHSRRAGTRANRHGAKRELQLHNCNLHHKHRNAYSTQEPTGIANPTLQSAVLISRGHVRRNAIVCRTPPHSHSRAGFGKICGTCNQATENTKLAVRSRNAGRHELPNPSHAVTHQVIILPSRPTRNRRAVIFFCVQCYSSRLLPHLLCLPSPFSDGPGLHLVPAKLPCLVQLFQTRGRRGAEGDDSLHVLPHNARVLLGVSVSTQHAKEAIAEAHKRASRATCACSQQGQKGAPCIIQRRIFPLLEAGNTRGVYALTGATAMDAPEGVEPRWRCYTTARLNHQSLLQRKETCAVLRRSFGDRSAMCCSYLERAIYMLLNLFRYKTYLKCYHVLAPLIHEKKSCPLDVRKNGVVVTHLQQLSASVEVQRVGLLVGAAVGQLRVVILQRGHQYPVQLQGHVKTWTDKNRKHRTEKTQGYQWFGTLMAQGLGSLLTVIGS